ncbi:bluetail domain-containing putative surface protein [Synechococcus elongatus]|uniref:Bluetail domain-containing putative surface protein n=1 Tax=Synechococcus elongatus PCC 11802 TaxID=2283154 RepID=A0AAT9JWC9_SYNEL|nr:bluetail domain-containing putative surface protein [Synechococcus elongatus]QFZ92177.1 DUF4214 domain-containing protein [Synechococcus elongatus PCC 11802]
MAFLRITSAQQLYVAFYGRPADVEGRSFWDSAVQAIPGAIDYAAIAEAFGESAEAQIRFGNLSLAEAVNTLYHSILNREADPVGRDFYVKALESGQISLANLAIAIVEGIQTDSLDAQTFLNKVLAADQFTNALDTLEEIQAYDFSTNAIALPTVQDFIAKVTADAGSVPNSNQVTAIVKQIVVTSGTPATATAIAEARIVVQGGDGNDQLNGSGGQATLIGAGGHDTMLAGSSDDSLTGGLGADVLTGGEGRDRFVYTTLADSLLSGFDRITDFQISLDSFEGPNPTSGMAVSNLGTVSSLDPSALAAVLTASNFLSNGAATFQFEQRTFLALNDDVAGFQSNRDALIEITGFQGDLANLSIV